VVCLWQVIGQYWGSVLIKNHGTYMPSHCTSLRPESSNSWSILSSSDATFFLLPSHPALAAFRSSLTAVMTVNDWSPPCGKLVSVPPSSQSSAHLRSPQAETSSFLPSSGSLSPCGLGQCQQQLWPANIPREDQPGKFGMLLLHQPWQPARQLQGLHAGLLKGCSWSESSSWYLVFCQCQRPTAVRLFRAVFWG
jgi:hypothetical protein